MSHNPEDCKMCPNATDCTEKEIIEEALRLSGVGIVPHAAWLVHARDDSQLFNARLEASVRVYVRGYAKEALSEFIMSMLAGMELMGHEYRLKANEAIASCHIDMIQTSLAKVMAAMRSLGTAMHSTVAPACTLTDLMHLLLNGQGDQQPTLKVPCHIPSSKLH